MNRKLLVSGAVLALSALVSLPAFAANDEETYRGDTLRYSYKTYATAETKTIDANGAFARRP